jgi:hypothetical protein
MNPDIWRKTAHYYCSPPYSFEEACSFEGVSWAAESQRCAIILYQLEKEREVLLEREREREAARELLLSLL